MDQKIIELASKHFEAAKVALMVGNFEPIVLIYSPNNEEENQYHILPVSSFPGKIETLPTVAHDLAKDVDAEMVMFIGIHKVLEVVPKKSQEQNIYDKVLNETLKTEEHDIKEGTLVMTATVTDRFGDHKFFCSQLIEKEQMLVFEDFEPDKINKCGTFLPPWTNQFVH